MTNRKTAPLSEEDQMIYKIRHWKAEAFNPRNDGWVQNHYREKLLKLREFLLSIDNLIIHS